MRTISASIGSAQTMLLVQLSDVSLPYSCLATAFDLLVKIDFCYTNTNLHSSLICFSSGRWISGLSGGTYPLLAAVPQSAAATNARFTSALGGLLGIAAAAAAAAGAGRKAPAMLGLLLVPVAAAAAADVNWLLLLGLPVVVAAVAVVPAMLLRMLLLVLRPVGPVDPATSTLCV